MNFYGGKAKEKLDGSRLGPGNWKLSVVFIIASALLLVMGIIFLNNYKSKTEGRPEPSRNSRGDMMPSADSTSAKDSDKFERKPPASPEKGE